MKSFEHQNVLKLHGVTLDTVYRKEFWSTIWLVNSAIRSAPIGKPTNFASITRKISEDSISSLTWGIVMMHNTNNKIWIIILKSPGLITTYMNKGDLRKFLRNSENQFSYKQVSFMWLITYDSFLMTSASNSVWTRPVVWSIFTKRMSFTVIWQLEIVYWKQCPPIPTTWISEYQILGFPNILMIIIKNTKHTGESKLVTKPFSLNGHHLGPQPKLLYKTGFFL